MWSKSKKMIIEEAREGKKKVINSLFDKNTVK